MSMHPDISTMASPVPARIQPVQLPRLPPAYIPRVRLSTRLHASEARLRLLCSPAGFGKSVLLNECARQAPLDTQVVWLDLAGRSLAVDDFLRLLAAALHHPIADGASLDAFIERLATRQTPLWLMLDDYPREPDPALDACFDRLLEQSSESIKWWVSSRLQPAWNLPRLLLQGDLCELEAEDLALDADELTALLERHSLKVPQKSRELLLHHSEGWLAGVCLLLMHADEHTLRERMEGGTLFLRDYIQREVLNPLPEELRTALFSLVHLPRFSASLCEHVLQGGGASLLTQLRTRQLFIRPLDSCGEWFRVWRPLAQVLPRLPDAVPPTQIYVRACQWFAAQGLLCEAVEHALLARQPEVAANYLQRFGQEQLLVGRNVSQFLRWRNELPHDLFASTPRLIMLQGWALIICARLDEAETCVADLAHFLPQPEAHRQVQLLAHWQALTGVLQRQRGYRTARVHCLEALGALNPKAWSQRALCHQTLAQHALAEGKLDEAEVQISEGLRLSRLNGSLIFETLINLDRIHLLDMIGESDRALELADQALLHLQGSVKQSPVLGRLLLLRGLLLASQGRDAESAQAYLQGSKEAEDSEDAHTIFGFLGLSELATRAGEVSVAFQRLREAERLMQWRHVPEVRYQSLIQLATGGLWLRQGDLVRAREAFEQVAAHYRSGELLPPSACYDLLPRLRRYMALIDLLEGNGARAIEDLRVLRQECAAVGLRKFACECRFTLAEALLVAGEDGEAERELREAVAEAEPMKLMRPLLELQQRKPEWIRQALPARRSQAPAPMPLVGTPAPERSSQGSPLSLREQAVLSLIAQGCSNQEIAEQLFISLHTVKTHARRINTKLGVARRTQAVAMAKSMGLVS